ncbi:MAG: efflux RND transporter periplasmic adaptor subunit [Thermoanaerobaculia bacterium]
MKRWSLGAVMVLALALVVAASIRGGGEEQGVVVYSEAVRREPMTQTVRASGEIRARVSVDLSAHVVAKIEEIHVEEGDRVEAGQPFVELERESFLATVESWRAQLRQAETRVRQAEVDLEDARLRVRRMRRLAEEGIVSAEELESRELQETSAELRLDEAGDAVEHARANLDKALDDLSKTTIYAPVSGRVVDLNAEEGEVVVSGMMNNPATKIATVADLSELLAELDVDENEIVRVDVDEPVTVTVDAIPDRTFPGRVVEVGSSGYARAGQGDVTFFAVDVLLEEADPQLRPGMSVRAEIEVASRQGALTVPVQAVVERPAGRGDGDADAGSPGESATEPVVFAVEGGHARRRPVETGLSTVTRVEVVSGLQEGDEVVTGPYRTLRDLEDGDPIRPDPGGPGEEGGERD